MKTKPIPLRDIQAALGLSTDRLPWQQSTRSTVFNTEYVLNKALEKKKKVKAE